MEDNGFEPSEVGVGQSRHPSDLGQIVIENSVETRLIKHRGIDKWVGILIDDILIDFAS